ncbi:MAG: 4a-hydroxytetrahydrobiopterin dehydratase [Bacteroidota bacterium]
MNKLTSEDITIKLEDLVGWSLVDNAIEKTFGFTDFKETFATMVRIAFECEAQNHHPNWSNVYNSLKIRLNTHDAGGVTEKDFTLARIIEDVIRSQ